MHCCPSFEMSLSLLQELEPHNNYASSVDQKVTPASKQLLISGEAAGIRNVDSVKKWVFRTKYSCTPMVSLEKVNDVGRTWKMYSLEPKHFVANSFVSVPIWTVHKLKHKKHSKQLGVISEEYFLEIHIISSWQNPFKHCQENWTQHRKSKHPSTQRPPKLVFKKTRFFSFLCG